MMAAALHDAGLAVLVLACAVLVLMAVCDIRTRTVPALGCYVFIALCIAFQVCCGGLSQVLAGAAWAGVLMLLCLLANRITAARARVAKAASIECAAAIPVAVGNGDMLCMTGLCFASGTVAPLGFALCYIAAGLFCLAGMLMHRLRFGDGIPLVPFFLIWLLSGSLASLGLG